MAATYLPAMRASLKSTAFRVPRHLAAEISVPAGTTPLHIAQSGAYVGTLLCRDAAPRRTPPVHCKRSESSICNPSC